MAKKISAVLPTHNEEPRIGQVLPVLIGSKLFDEIIVVDDASSDNSSEVIRKNFPQVKIVAKKKSTGKGDALIFGAEKAKNDILFFCDADLTNLRKNHLNLLIDPVVSGRLKMTVGAQEYMNPIKKNRTYKQIKKEVFNNFGGDGRPYFNEYLKGMGGERVIYKKDFLKVKTVKSSRYGVEQEINLYFLKKGWKFDYYILKGVGHYAKGEKWGLFKGLIRDLDYLFTAAFNLGKRVLVINNVRRRFIKRR